MTEQSEGSLQVDMGRVAQRAANNAAGAVADLSTQLAMAQEIAELRAERIGQLEDQLAGKTAELARAVQAAEMLQQQAEAGPPADVADQGDGAGGDDTAD